MLITAITATGTPCRCMSVAEMCLTVQLDVPDARSLHRVSPVPG